MADAGSDRTLLLLDVDGVLAPMGADAPSGSFDDWRRHELRAKTIFGRELDVSLQLSRQLAGAVAALDVDIVWASTWCTSDQANTLVAPLLGWAPLPNAIAPDLRPRLSDGTDSWKLEGLHDFFAQLAAAGRMPRRVVWADDRLASRHHAELFARFGVSPLLVQPDPAVGLTRAVLERIAAYADRATVS